MGPKTPTGIGLRYNHSIGDMSSSSKDGEIREESDRFSVFIDPKTIDHVDRKKEILESALDLLNNLG